ncbi:MAG TPA: hypothetical protein VEC59_05205 [Steroidobacteraceae bacterium]|nr:hypothetical protein [Steroidobacteraceae bacterium]
MRLRLAAVLTLGALAASGCDRHTAGSSAPPPPPPLRAWPEGRAPPMKITDDLTLAVPLAFERTAVEREPAPAGAGSPGAGPPGSAHGEVHFDFFLPDFSGYTLDNYRSDADPNRVEVVYVHAGDPHEAEPDAPGEYPPNMLKRALQQLLDPKQHRDQYGLRCYPGRVFTNRITCFGRRGPEPGEDIMLTALVPPYAADLTFPMYQARYFSRRYGGVRIEWRAHVSQLARWRAIDAQIWRFIDGWRVVPPSSGAAAAPEPAG